MNEGSVISIMQQMQMMNDLPVLLKQKSPQLLEFPWTSWRSLLTGKSLLHSVAEFGEADFLAAVLKTPAADFLTIRDGNNNRIPLDYAVKRNSIPMVKLFLQAMPYVACTTHVTTRCPLYHLPYNVDQTALQICILVMNHGPGPFPNGHSQCWGYPIDRPDPVWLAETEMLYRDALAWDAFLPFLFYLRRRMTGPNAVVYREVVLPMLREIWNRRKLEPWKSIE